MGRGRPKLVMTHRRRQVLDELIDHAANGQRVSLGHLMRRCGFYGREDVKRVIRDLKAMGII
jgi:hypothetical protein